MGQTPSQAEALAATKFKDLGAYFSARQGETFGSMADELGVSSETVRRWYREWAEEATR